MHQCLGQTLARVELQEAYSALVTRLPGLRLADAAGAPVLKHDGEVYGLRELPVTWDGGDVT